MTDEEFIKRLWLISGIPKRYFTVKRTERMFKIKRLFNEK
jgi:hypothetical protein